MDIREDKLVAGILGNKDRANRTNGIIPLGVGMGLDCY